MATRVSKSMPRDLRYEPTEKWVRAQLDGHTVVDTKRALLVWKPDTVVPGYAVPREDLRFEELPDGAAEGIDDPDLEGYLALDFHAFDAWFEEAEPIVGHPRDPFKRIDIRESSRHVQVQVGGETVADSRRASLLFETGLPVRYYIPPDDVRSELLTPTDHETYCAYKGQASYWTVEAGGERHENLAWTYSEPLSDSRQISGMIAFFNERSDILVDGEPMARPKTQWS
jgi:uncharacterized protein (DUF427 family)